MKLLLLFGDQATAETQPRCDVKEDLTMVPSEKRPTEFELR